MKQKTGTIYYSDELNDEFAFDDIVPRKIGGEYAYVQDSPWKKFTRFFWYRLIAFPAAFFYLKICYRHKIVNRGVIKKFSGGAFFLFGNHTHNICDALIPTFVSFPKSVRVIVHANNISMPVLGAVTPSLGAIPLPDDRDSTRNFLNCIKIRVAQKEVLTIYPEAHIWPFYTKIRPFSAHSFRYPVQYGVPSFCFTNVYKKRRFSKNPRIVTYVDGPFFADENLSASEKRENLRNKIFSAMTERARLNEVELIKYVKISAEKNCNRPEKNVSN
jgi:1-acyl-sn-glycerol-3-phosphate acyltransferase